MYPREELIEAIILEYQQVRSRQNIRASFAKKYPSSVDPGSDEYASVAFDPHAETWAAVEHPEDQARWGLRPGMPSRVGNNIEGSKHARHSRRAPRKFRKAEHYKKRRGSIDRGFDFAQRGKSSSHDFGPDPLF